MSDTIRPDGLTDEERAWRSDSDLRGFVGIVGMFDTLAAERLAHTAEKAAHAETRARAEKAEAERDRLRAGFAALDRIVWMAEKYAEGGSRYGPERRDFEEAMGASAAARALLGEVKT